MGKRVATPRLIAEALFEQMGAVNPDTLTDFDLDFAFGAAREKLGNPLPPVGWNSRSYSGRALMENS